MIDVQVSIVGTLPLLVHSQAGMNRANPVARELAVLNSKRGKTDEDYARISDLEMELAVYWCHKRDVAIFPAFNIIRSVQDGGKMLKCGKKVIQGIRIHPDYQEPEILYTPKLPFVQFVAEPSHRDCRTVRVSGTVNRTRGRFDAWAIEPVVLMDETMLQLDELNASIEKAGLYVGLGDFRVGTARGGRYGTYTGMAKILGGR